MFILVLKKHSNDVKSDEEMKKISKNFVINANVIALAAYYVFFIKICFLVFVSLRINLLLFADIEFRDDDVENIYMDPTGDHVIISMASESNYYLHRLSKSLKILSKFSVSCNVSCTYSLAPC